MKHIKNSNTASMPSIFKQTWGLAAPLALSRLVQTASSFVLMAYIAQLGHEALAAGGLIAAAQLFMNVSTMSLLFVVAPIVSRQCGENNLLSAGTILQTSWLIGLILALPLFVLYSYMGQIESYLHQPAVIIDEVSAFFGAAKWGTFALIINVGTSQFFIGTKAKKLVSILSVASLTSITFFGYIFIFGAFGVKGMGIVGAGWAWTAAIWTRLLTYIFLLITLPMFKVYQVFKVQLHQWSRWLKTIVKVGAPLSIQVMVEMSSIFILANLVGLIGVNALGAYQIITQFGMLLIVPMFGISETASVLVGHAIGSGKLQQIKAFARAALQLGLALSLIGVALFSLCPHWLASAYINFNSPHATVIYAMVKWMLGFYAISLTFNGLAITLSGALRGLQDTVFSMKIEVVTKWGILVPLAILFAFIFHWKLPGVILAGLIANIFNVAMMAYRWHKLCLNQKKD